MKKIIIVSILLVLAGSFAFTQEQDPGFSNTLYANVGNGDIYNVTGNPDQVGFSGFVNYFTANVTISGLTIAGDIAYSVFDGGLNAYIIADNFNVVFNPIANFDIGVGTNLDWEVGPEPSYGPHYAAYEVPYYAGLTSLGISRGYVANHFAADGVGIRYNIDDTFIVGAALNGGINANGVGIGVQANLSDNFSLGFAYNGGLGGGDNNFYIGSTIYTVDGLDIDLWANFDIDYASVFGGRIEFYKDNFRFIPEASITTFDKSTNNEMSIYAALIAEMSFSDEVLGGLNVSWGTGGDAISTNNVNESEARLNVAPHLVWNINDNNRLAIAVNLMPVWLNNNTNDFYWNLPVSWKVIF